MPNQGKHFKYLDGWRGLAIAFLLIGHFFPVPGINFGTVGVNFFFVLSGLLMGRLLFLQKVSLSSFYGRRISRIFPAAFCFIGVTLAAYPILGLQIEWTEVITAALFINNYFFDDGQSAVMPFGHIWSLSVEEHSYILLSLIAFFSRQKWIRVLFSLGAAVSLSACIGLHYHLNSGHLLPMSGKVLRSEVSAFGILISVAFLLRFDNRPFRSLPWFACPALVLFGLAMHWWSVPHPARIVLGVGAFALAVNMLSQAPKPIHAALSIKPLRQLGTWSFSLYLWQQPFYLLVHRDGMSPWMGLSLGILCGIVSFYLIERPARNYLNRKWDRSREQEPLTSPAPAA